MKGKPVRTRKKNPAAVALGRRGGKAFAKAFKAKTPEEQFAIASHAGKNRWKYTKTKKSQRLKGSGS